MGSERNFGNQTLGALLIQFPPANNKAVCRFVNDTGVDLDITTLCGMWTVNNAGAKLKGIIYSDNSGSPNQLLATSNEKVGVIYGWNSFTFPTPLTVTAGTAVWIGVIGDTVVTTGKGITGSVYYNADTYADGPSQTFGSASTNTRTYPIFVVGNDNTDTFGRRSIDILGMIPGDGNYQPDREHIDRVVLGGTNQVNVSSIFTYITNTEAAAKSKAAIYADNGSGYPGALVAQSSEVTGSTADTWMELPIPGGVVLNPGVYWLAFITDINLTTGVIPFTGHLIVDGPITEATAWPSSYPETSLEGPFIIDPVTDGRGIDIYAAYAEIIPDPPENSGAGGPCVYFF